VLKSGSQTLHKKNDEIHQYENDQATDPTKQRSGRKQRKRKKHKVKPRDNKNKYTARTQHKTTK